jgi:hypothetical protein
MSKYSNELVVPQVLISDPLQLKSTERSIRKAVFGAQFAVKWAVAAYLSRYSGGHHAKVEIRDKAHCNPLLLLGYHQ